LNPYVQTSHPDEIRTRDLLFRGVDDATPPRKQSQKVNVWLIIIEDNNDDAGNGWKEELHFDEMFWFKRDIYVSLIKKPLKDVQGIIIESQYKSNNKRGSNIVIRKLLEIIEIINKLGNKRDLEIKKQKAKER
jgi:hypothetical protein